MPTTGSEASNHRAVGLPAARASSVTMSPAEMRACRDRPEPFSITSDGSASPWPRYHWCSHWPARSGGSAPCPLAAAISSSSIRVITLLLNLLM